MTHDPQAQALGSPIPSPASRWSLAALGGVNSLALPTPQKQMGPRSWKAVLWRKAEVSSYWKRKLTKARERWTAVVEGTYVDLGREQCSLQSRIFVTVKEGPTGAFWTWTPISLVESQSRRTDKRPPQLGGGPSTPGSPRRAAPPSSLLHIDLPSTMSFKERLPLLNRKPFYNSFSSPARVVSAESR